QAADGTAALSVFLAFDVIRQHAPGFLPGGETVARRERDREPAEETVYRRIGAATPVSMSRRPHAAVLSGLRVGVREAGPRGSCPRDDAGHRPFATTRPN